MVWFQCSLWNDQFDDQKPHSHLQKWQEKFQDPQISRPINEWPFMKVNWTEIEIYLGTGTND